MTHASGARACPELKTVSSASWLVGPWFDSACIAWAWVPFYAFIVFVLGLDGNWSSGGRDGHGTEPGLGLAMLLALGVSYVHRHYTFLLVYGDAETFRQRERAYTLIPAVLFVALALILRWQGDLSVMIAGQRLRPWMIILVITGAWNVWHTIMQRHGINRIYAGKAGGGLQSPAHARRDLFFLWSLVALTAVVTTMFRPDTFAAIGNARRLLRAVDPILHGVVGWSLLLAVVGVVVVAGTSWFRHERAATVAPSERVPRLGFMLSTLALLSVFVLHGPIIGYICFGIAHAIEYVFFFHVFGRRKFVDRDPSRRGVVGSMLARPLVWGPVFALALTGLFFALADHRKTEPYLVYYTATSLLHFLYDGWIWKVRKPEVAQPLGLVQPT